MLPKWIGNLFAIAIVGPVLNAAVDSYKAKLSAGNDRDRMAVDLAKTDIEAEADRRRAQRDLGIVAMSHPVWWVAWCLFVIPVGLYHATIFIVSTLGIPPCGGITVSPCFTVLRVPTDQQELSRAIIAYLFLAQGASGIAGAVIKKLSR